MVKLDKQNFIQILNSPKQLEIKTLKELKTLIDKYPYFQSARAVYLKSLKDQGSFRYNNELKTVAAYTTDRTVLFDFITSEAFDKEEVLKESKTISKEKEIVEEVVEEVEEVEEEIVEEKVVEEAIVEEETVEKEVVEEKIVENIKDTSEKESINIEEKITKTEVEEAKEELEIGKPLLFKKDEKHSFSQWLQLSVHKPVVQDKKPSKGKEKKSLQDSIIEKFITNSPKISRVDKSSSYEVKVEEMEQQPQLMTETLARVYLEQKKYGNAIKAYEILSLKYPEKSGFFADQIKKIRILQNNR